MYKQLNFMIHLICHYRFKNRYNIKMIVYIVSRLFDTSKESIKKKSRSIIQEAIRFPWAFCFNRVKWNTHTVQTWSTIKDLLFTAPYIFAPSNKLPFVCPCLHCLLCQTLIFFFICLIVYYFIGMMGTRLVYYWRFIPITYIRVYLGK